MLPVCLFVKKVQYLFFHLFQNKAVLISHKKQIKTRNDFVLKLQFSKTSTPSKRQKAVQRQPCQKPSNFLFSNYTFVAIGRLVNAQFQAHAEEMIELSLGSVEMSSHVKSSVIARVRITAVAVAVP